jgi:hypothetical protein
MQTAVARTKDMTLLAAARAGDQGAFDRLAGDRRDSGRWPGRLLATERVSAA